MAKMIHQLSQIQAHRNGWRSVPLTSIEHEIGFAYLAVTGHPELSSDRHPSPACVLEDDVPLPGPGNALHDDIRQVGRGRYCFWHDYVYFSTSDNSDPCTNERRYEISWLPTSIGSVVVRLFDIVTRTFGIHVLFRWMRLLLYWGRGIVSWILHFPKTLPNALWTIVYWSLFSWVLWRGRGKVK